jgi:hypothetical protein
MKIIKINKIIIEIILVSISINAQIDLITDKTNYLTFEPIYITINKISPEAKKEFPGTLKDMAAFFLQIEAPYSTKQYSPPIRIESLTLSKHQVSFETVIISQGEYVTRIPGRYILVLKDRKDNDVSNKAYIEISDPINSFDIEAVKIIKENPLEYAMVLYLEGGDHLASGMSIVKRLSESNSGYSNVARAILSIAYSQISFDWEKLKIRRDRDVVKSAQMFPPKDDNRIPESLKLEAAMVVAQQIPKETMPQDLKNAIYDMEKRYSGSYLSMSKQFESLESSLLGQ